MIAKRLFYFCVFLVLPALFAACSDDDSSNEFLFEREATEITVLRECAEDADSGAVCYQVRYRFPMTRENFSGVYVWIDSLVVRDTAKEVSSKQIDQADAYYAYSSKKKALYDTIDLTKMVEKYVEEYDSLHVAIFCAYSDDDDVGAVQHIYLHFGDDIPPSRASIQDSVWTTGALFEWYRPADQTDFYKPMELSGPILGYNLEIYSYDKNEDLRDVKIKVMTADAVDSTGGTLYKRHARVRADEDSVWIDSVNHGDKVKNYLRIAVIDGKGFDFEADSMNRFRVIVEGLKAETRYTVGISSWDSSGNSSGNEGTGTVETNMLFITTDSIAPLMPTKIFILEDSLFPGYARLDSNNRLRIFWNESIDPIDLGYKIEVDSIIDVEKVGCVFGICYDTVSMYMVDRYDPLKKEWVMYDTTGMKGHYSKRYKRKGNKMEVSSTGTFVTDTIIRVSPGDTLILRIRSIDKSGYISKALIDTILVSPGALAKEVECPDGFVAVQASDSSKFCMEPLEHRDENGDFVTDVLHSEAVEACESMSASGFTVGLCNERDWELVCLSGGSLAYGVIEEEDIPSTEYLFTYCNVGTNDSTSSMSYEKRDSRCVNPMGVRDMPGQLQEWVMGRSEDTVAVIKGASYKVFDGLDRETMGQCTNRFFPFYTRPAYTTDTVYLYREGAKVDTVLVADTSRTLYGVLTKKDFKDSLQFFDVQDSSGNKLGEDYAPYAEYKKGGDEWLSKLAGSLVYKPSRVKAVFLTGERVPYRAVSAFYKSRSIGFRCCAYPE